MVQITKWKAAKRYIEQRGHASGRKHHVKKNIRRWKGWKLIILGDWLSQIHQNLRDSFMVIKAFFLPLLIITLF